ncbi:uncharacterized protein LOC122384709 [Amphibalanus amphitrite]|uniref:uncharacterized protein LOC122384709 n=1 Tax=Amphibalanus amphitrite TaxID=1232801 RepID=UPI001C8FBB6B|nr:uncharacterized protein LOC122384709 [Amphibalanus amphitrite]
MRSWLLVAVVLVTLFVCLEAGQKPRRGRYSRLHRKAHTIAGQVKRYQLKQRRRGEAANNEVSAVAKAGSRAKGKSSQKRYRTKSKQLQNSTGKAGRPQRNNKQRNRSGRRRPATAKDVCLFRALRRCGKRVLKRLRSSPDFEIICRTKERFIDCMSMSQRRGCKARKRRRRRRGPSRRLIKQYQRRLQKALTKARGCVIGVDLSAAAPLTDR